MATKKATVKTAKNCLTLKQKSLLKEVLHKQLSKCEADKLLKGVGLGNALPKGMTKVVAKTIKIEGLSKTTGRILKGYYYGKGGKILKSQALKDKEKTKACKK